MDFKDEPEKSCFQQNMKIYMEIYSDLWSF